MENDASECLTAEENNPKINRFLPVIEMQPERTANILETLQSL